MLCDFFISVDPKNGLHMASTLLFTLSAILFSAALDMYFLCVLFKKDSADTIYVCLCGVCECKVNYPDGF